MSRSEAADAFSARNTIDEDTLKELIDTNDIKAISRVLETPAKDSVEWLLRMDYDQSLLKRLFEPPVRQHTGVSVDDWWKTRCQITRLLVSEYSLEGYLKELYSGPFYVAPVWDVIANGQDMSEKDTSWIVKTLVPERVLKDPRQMGPILLTALRQNNPRFLKAALEAVKKAKDVYLADEVWLDVMGALQKTEVQKVADPDPVVLSSLWRAVPQEQRYRLVQKTGLLADAYGHFHDGFGSKRVLETLDALPSSKQRLEALRDMNKRVPLLTASGTWEYCQFTVRPGSPAWQQMPEPLTSMMSDVSKYYPSGFGKYLQLKRLPFHEMKVLSDILTRLSEPEQRTFLELPVPFPGPSGPGLFQSNPEKSVSVPLYTALFCIFYMEYVEKEQELMIYPPPNPVRLSRPLPKLSDVRDRLLTRGMEDRDW